MISKEEINSIISKSGPDLKQIKEKKARISAAAEATRNDFDKLFLSMQEELDDVMEHAREEKAKEPEKKEEVKAEKAPEKEIRIKPEEAPQKEIRVKTEAAPVKEIEPLDDHIFDEILEEVYSEKPKPQVEDIDIDLYGADTKEQTPHVKVRKQIPDKTDITDIVNLVIKALVSVAIIAVVILAFKRRRRR